METARTKCTLAKFCGGYRMSGAFSWLLEREGLTPVVTRAGRRMLVLQEAAAVWFPSMESESHSVWSALA